MQKENPVNVSMNRRKMLTWVGLAPAGSLAPRSGQAAKRDALLLQDSPVAGFQYYRGEAIWSALSVGDELRLFSERDDHHDSRAIEIYWQDEKLGYVPRSDNAIVSLLDRGHRLNAKLAKIEISTNPWQRLSVEIWLDE